MPTKTKTKLPKDALVSEILEVVSKQRSKAKNHRSYKRTKS